MHKIINLSSTADRKSINYNNDVVNNPNSDNNSDLTIYSGIFIRFSMIN